MSPKQGKSPRPIVQIPPEGWSKGLADALRREGYFPVCLRAGTLTILDTELIAPTSAILRAALTAIRDADATEGARTRFGRALATLLADEKKP